MTHTHRNEKPPTLARALKNVYWALGILAAVGVAGFSVAAYLGGLARASDVEGITDRMSRLEEQHKAEVERERADDARLRAADDEIRGEVRWLTQQVYEIAQATRARIISPAPSQASQQTPDAAKR